MSGLSIKVVGAGKVIRRLEVVGMRAADVAPAWPDVAEMISEEVGVNFDTQGRWFGAPWRPLAASTIAQKHGPAPLVETGRLRGLLSRRKLPIFRMTGTSLTIGTHDRIAHFQHGGTHMNGRRHIPPRVLIKATPRMKKKATKILAYWVMVGKT